MGNKLGRRRQVVDEKYTKPQGLYQHRDVDHKKLRKLILDSKLAPCYPGDDDCSCELEECPICFLYYPSLNRSRCCTKGICTECFLQMKTPNSTRPTQCPFCKTSNYAVEYRGGKTKEEKGLEQLEEQRVIEAKIRIMRQQEIQDEEERSLKQREVSSSSSIITPIEVEYCSTPAPTLVSAIESEEVASHESSTNSTIRPPPRPRQIRDDGFDLDLEDIMVMEAIWLSIQENGRHHDLSYDAAQSEEYTVEEGSSSALADIAPAGGPSSSSSFSPSPSGGLACAIAALAERQQINEPTPTNYGGNTSVYNVEGQLAPVSPNSQLAMTRDAREWPAHSSDIAEEGTSYTGSDEFTDATHPANPNEDENQCDVQPGSGSGSGSGLIVPESFEEQMMLAMAVSLAEARARTTAPGVARR